MEEVQWKLGDPCFIADISVSETYARMAIMPAIVTHTGGPDGSAVIATARSTRPYGPLFLEGAPFRSEAAVREHLADYAHRVAKAAQAAETTGQRPQFAVPAKLPQNGEVVYVIEKELGEVLEAQVGIVQFDLGRVVIGYDQSPSNPEASNIRATEWWRDKNEALRIAQERHGRPFAFVSKEELARRTDAAIDKIFDDALNYAQSPEFAAAFDTLPTS